MNDNNVSGNLSPSEVYVSGWPFMQQGWNGKYTRTTNKNEFILKPYALYGCIDIIGARILYQDGQWHFKRDCDLDVICHNDSLEDKWDYFYVSRHNKKTYFKKLCIVGLLLSVTAVAVSLLLQSHCCCVNYFI